MGGDTVLPLVACTSTRVCVPLATLLALSTASTKGLDEGEGVGLVRNGLVGVGVVTVGGGLAVSVNGLMKGLVQGSLERERERKGERGEGERLGDTTRCSRRPASPHEK